eukprot:Selendium_serpulae@DN10902_c0_g1_i1.p1
MVNPSVPGVDHEYSIWVTFDLCVLRKITDKVADWNSQLNTTPFIPHITICPAPPQFNTDLPRLLTAAQKAVTRFAAEREPLRASFSIRSTKIDAGKSLFQCVY